MWIQDSLLRSVKIAPVVIVANQTHQKGMTVALEHWQVWRMPVADTELMQMLTFNSQTVQIFVEQKQLILCLAIRQTNQQI